MAADAEGKRIGEDAAVLRERVHRHLPPVLQCGGVLIAAGHGDVDVPLGGKPLRVATNGLQQLFLAACGAAHLGTGVQQLPLDLQKGLDLQNRANGRGSGGHATAPAKIFQGLHAHIHNGIQPAGLQLPPDLLCPAARLPQGHGVPRGAFLRDGNAVIVHHKHPALVILRQHLRRGAGGRETAGHGDVHQFLVFGQHLVPKGCHIAGGRLGGGDRLTLRQCAEKLIRQQVDPLVIRLSLNDDRHRQNENVHFLRFCLCNAAVAVCYNGCFHAFAPYV